MQLTKRMKDLTGQTFGSLTAIKPVRLTPQGTVLWLFKCACGESTEWIGNNAVSTAKKTQNPRVPSCGCVKIARNVELQTTHGYSKHPLHVAWQAMKQRCYNPNHPEYSRYGAKGVEVCSAWRDDAAAFIGWALNNGWKKGRHLDKDIASDAKGGLRVYSPDTCQFISVKRNVGYSASRSNHLHNTRIRLTPEHVIEINQLYESGQMNQYELATKFCVSQAAIWRAIHNTASHFQTNPQGT